MIKYGGLWIDSTVLCMNNEIPDYIWNTELFMYRQAIKKNLLDLREISSWLISAKKNNKLLKFTRDMLYLYWSKENRIQHYFLLHYFFHIVINEFSNEWGKTPVILCGPSLYLSLEMFKPFNQKRYEEIGKERAFQKISYKYKVSNNVKGTFYEKILEEYNIK